jgi:cytochrome c-type biogenesis protein CcsB
MGKLYRFFSSSSLALLLLLVFAIAMGTATFIENDFGIATSWKLIYNAFWFELVMLGLGLCFLFNIPKYRLWRRDKWAVLLFHLAFILILIGAAITRYHAESGLMRIREGAQSNWLISDAEYLQVTLKGGDQNKTLKKKLEFSPLGDNEFSLSSDYYGSPLTVSFADFIADAAVELVEDAEHGEPLLEMVVSDGNEKTTLILKEGEVEALGDHGHRVGFATTDTTAVDIRATASGFSLYSPVVLDFFTMSTQTAGKIKPDSLQQMELKSLYRWHDVSFVPNRYFEKGRIDLVSASEKPKENDPTRDDVLKVNVQLGDTEKEATLLYRKGFLPAAHSLDFGDTQVELAFGSDSIPLPFALKLTDFQLERYPGSSSPSSYASEVEIIDGGQHTPYRIYMNHVLDHKGYRFFQASYDTDEQGTVLAVNRDALGTWITYVGYFLMSLGMCFTLFGKTSRFRFIHNKLKKLQKQSQRAAVLLLLCVGVNAVSAQSPTDSLAVTPINEIHAEAFGRLFVQDLDGRIKPINSLASEFLRKLSGKPYLNYQDQRWDANQVFLAMHAEPNAWKHIPLIKMDPEKGGELLQDIQQHANGLSAFSDFLGANGAYLLAEAVEKANQKKPALRSERDKELIKVDERFNIMFNVLSGNYLKVFPNKNDANDSWFTHTHHFEDFPAEDAQFAQGILPLYFRDVLNQDYAAAYEKLHYIAVYQNTLAAHIVPSEAKLNAEIWYNKLNLNFWMFPIFFTLGALLLILSIVKVLVQKKGVDTLWFVGFLGIFIAFLAFTGNLILRWYISGHAPWSNGYEMLVFVAWCLALSGLLTHRSSVFILPLATLFSGALLFVSYLDWLNPEITNLMPVLKSYWLKIHVATIVSSYAPLALGALLGLMALVLIALQNPKNHQRLQKHILELTYMNELLLTIGLFLLAIGTFLGGVWANESWGRYWAWDPKETWALICVIIYAIVLHLRFVPKLNNALTFNTASMWAFWSIIMTSFGVNYYLTGLHSYATGDPVPIPTFIYVLAGIMLALTVIAIIRHRKRRV